jgi:uncharacterized protein (TIGR02001 family)
MKTTTLATACLLALTAFGASPARAQDAAQVTVGVDLVSRYIWRGIDAADAPSAQPAVTLEYRGFALGAWGSYSLSNDITRTDEIDLWLRYAHDLGEGGSLGILLTDYYFPNAGRAFSNYHDYDAVDPGGHVLEIGALLTPPSMRLTLAGYVNVYNDRGHNVFLEASYPFAVGATDVTLFAAATPGSSENPAYYGTDRFKFLHVGVGAKKSIALSDRFSLPLSVSWSVNPNLDIAYLVVGISL